MKITFHAKYSEEITKTTKVPTFGYHITSNLFLDKILKIGLTPKTKSKLGGHPPRIYMTKTFNDSINFVFDLFEKDLEKQDKGTN